MMGQPIRTAKGWVQLAPVGVVQGQEGTYEKFIPSRNDIGRGGKDVRRDFQAILDRVFPEHRTPYYHGTTAPREERVL